MQIQKKKVWKISVHLSALLAVFLSFREGGLLYVCGYFLFWSALPIPLLRVLLWFYVWWDKKKFNKSEEKLKARETALTSASFVGSCLLFWSGALLCPAASPDCSQPRCCLYNRGVGAKRKADPVMREVVWKCLGSSAFFSFSTHLSLSQLINSLCCIYFSRGSFPLWSAMQGEVFISLVGLDC